MNKMVEKSLSVVDMTYDSVIDIANEIIEKVCEDSDKLIQEACDNVENMTNDYIRDLMLKLSLKSYTFSEVKEKSAFKAVIGEMIRKEQYAINFNRSEGTVAVRENIAIIDTSAEFMAEEIYTLVSNMLKTKLYEVHAVISTLQTVLTSRLQEAKLTRVDTM